MKLSRAGEFGAIERIKGICRSPGREVRVGIGDDAAAFSATEGVLTLVTADMLVEGIHFDLSFAGFRELGWKALAVNISDIAAMGGRPRYYIVSLALRPDIRVEDVETLYEGMEAMAECFGVYAIGGDTCRTDGPMVISITVIGDTVSAKPVTRSGARPGDDIYVTGTLGGSAGGLELLKSGVAGGEGSPEQALVFRHLLPVPRVGEGVALAEAGLATAMIDISDGLSSDLGHILEQSGVGAEIQECSIPVSDELPDVLGKKKALNLALHGGEDYELLFTARKKNRKAVEGLGGGGFTRIGSITRGGEACLVTGKGTRRSLARKGYEHFHK